MNDNAQPYFNFESMNLKVGLEVHQQLFSEHKLFCQCPPFSGESDHGNLESETENLQEFPIRFRRILRPTTSELGEMDEAARFETRREIRALYLANRASSCLVEADEEPPHPLNEEALDTAVVFALSLNSRLMDEIHVMRKLVVDGSNTSGFQRTAVIALGGRLQYKSEKSSVDVQSISLEEDAARTVKRSSESDRIESQNDGYRTYALDRLGTPLVEMALAPIDSSLEDVENAAKTLGRLMRSTGRVARGLGTIRQDLNISVMDGKVIEVKGVQKLDLLRKVVQFEAARQKFFFDIAQEIKEKIGDKLDVSSIDVTDFFATTRSSIISKALKAKESKVGCLIIRGFSGFIGKKNQFGSRLGKELGAIAKTYALGGVIHSDELPNYGITSEEVFSLRKRIGADPADAFVLISGATESVDTVCDVLVARIRHCLSGVPSETRAATSDGETVYLRPRPGAARMYPETDIPLIQLDKSKIERLKKIVPEPWERLIENFAKKYDLPEQLSEPLYDSERKDLFEKIIASTNLSPRYVASVLIDMLQSLARDGVSINELSDETLGDALISLDQGIFAKEALPEILRSLASDQKISVRQAIEKVGLNAISKEELTRIIDQVIDENSSLIQGKGKASQSSLMGKVMSLVRGRVDGKLVNETLSERLDNYLNRKG